MTSETPQFYDRTTGEIRNETVLGDKWLRRAYCSPIRGLLRWPLFGCGFFSRMMGWYLDRPGSCKKIQPTVEQLGIDMSEAIVPEGGFRSFNDFFARELTANARPLPEDAERLISPADCRLTVYPQLDQGTVVPVKGRSYTVAELLGPAGADEAAVLSQGSLMVCRLCPADYHRYHFPDEGRLLRRWNLRGKYHSVNPLALGLGLPVFTENLRTVTMLRLKHAEQCAFIAVGAFGVASIHNFLEPMDAFNRGDQAGYFTFGGSTIIMILPPGVVQYDADIVKNSAAGIETLVKVNSPIGTWI